MSKFYHPVNGKIVTADQIDQKDTFISDRLFKPDSWDKFYYDDTDKNNRTYGIEIELNTEVSTSFDRAKICLELLKVLNKDGKHFHIMRDNSVRNGIELVSAPMTYKYWIEMFNVKEVNDLFTNLNLTATIDTGLHIHVGIKHTQRIRELYLQLFAISYPLWIYISDRRVLRIQDRYVSTRFFMDKDEQKSRFKQTLLSLIEHKTARVDYSNLSYYDYGFNDRYTGLNFFNDKTIEFRMFSGTDNFYDIIKYLTLVDVIVKISDEISETRINDVYNLADFVKRTKSELMLEETVNHIRFINSKYNKKRIYYNHFMFLDSHWYQVPLKNVKRKDFALEKSVYEEYLSLIEKYEKNELYPESFSIKYDINNLLLNNLMEVVKSNEEDIYVIGLRANTKAIKLNTLSNFIFLRGVNSSLII